MSSKVLLIRSDRSPSASDALCALIQGHFGAQAVDAHADHPAALIRRGRASRSTIRSVGVVHALGGPALVCAIAGGAKRIVYTPTRWPTRHATGWLRAAMRYRSIDVLSDSLALRETLVARGLPAQHVHSMRPFVDVDAFTSVRDDALRQRLGIARTDRVLFVPGDFSRDGGHSMAVWGASVAAVVDERYRLIVRSDRPIHDAVRERLLNPSVLIDAAALAPDLSPAQLFSAADAVVFMPTGPIPPSLLAMAMASGRPILARSTPQTCELLRSGATAVLVDHASPHSVAQEIGDLFADPQRMTSLGQQARAEAASLFGEATAIASLERVYDGIASGATKTA